MKSLQDLKQETTFNDEMHDLIDILRKTAVAQFQVLFSKQKTLSIENRFTKYLNKMFDLITFVSASAFIPVSICNASKILSMLKSFSNNS